LSTRAKGVFSCFLGKNKENTGKIGLRSGLTAASESDFFVFGSKHRRTNRCSLHLQRTHKNVEAVGFEPAIARLNPGVILAILLFSNYFEIYSAVPFIGIVNWLISLPSSSRRAFFRMIPPPYPVRLPSAPTTRWQGTMMQIGL